MQLLLASLAIAASATIQQIPTDDLELLAHLINAEAGATYCSDEMRYMVGAVALNRVESEDFPDTLEEVIFQDSPCLQYACITDGNFEKEPTDSCYEIAEDLLMNGSEIPNNVVYQAEFEQGSGTYKKIGNMYFCYADEKGESESELSENVVRIEKPSYKTGRGQQQEYLILLER
jgi:hypothetical protein